MKNKFMIITNNLMVEDELGKNHEIMYINTTYDEILKKVRDKIYEGYPLLSHPLSGSVKPNETPYKSIMIGMDKEKLDFTSVEIIEKAIETFIKFEKKNIKYSERAENDFKLIDFTLISSAISSVL